MTLTLSSSSFVLSVIVFLSLMESVFPLEGYDDVPNHDEIGFVIVFTCAFLFMCFSLVGIIFVLVRIYIKWKDTQRTLSIALRVPLYLGVLNLILWVIELVNYIYPVIYHTPWPGQSCKIVAGVATAFTLVERFMTASIAIVTYLRVCRRICWSYGRYDWKLWFISGGISLLFTIMGSSKFGSAIYWCGALRHDPYVLIVGLGVSILVLLICIYCYLQTIMAVRAAVKQTSTVNAVPKNSNSSDNHLNSRGVRGRRHSTAARSAADNNVEARVTKKVMGYILVFILQWFPIFPYDIYQILNRSDAWVYALVAISFNLGGIGNAVCYVINEGWDPHRSTSMTGGNEDNTSHSSSARNVGSSRQDDDDDLANPLPHEHSTVLEISRVVMVNSGEKVDGDLVDV